MRVFFREDTRLEADAFLALTIFEAWPTAFFCDAGLIALLFILGEGDFRATLAEG